MKNSYFSTGLNLIQERIGNDELSLEFILSSMKKILANANFLEKENSQGGFLTLMDAIDGEIIFTVPFGEIEKEKEEKYFNFSQEKAKRLFSQIPNGHTSSYQSKNEEEEKFAGAIYFKFYWRLPIIFSFSGKSELLDEAMVYVLGERISWHIEKSALSIEIEVEKRKPFNPFLIELSKKCA